jgi:TPR repeat protein
MKRPALLITAAVLVSGALALGCIALSRTNAEKIDDWRMQAISRHQPLATLRLQVAQALGNQAAKLALAQVFIADIDVSQVQRGVSLLRELAQTGNARAQLQLGRLYLKGQTGVEVNYVESRRWLTKAAAFTKPQVADPDEPAGPDAAPAGYAAFYLASIYRNGYGVMKDEQAAFGWLVKSANAGVPQAQFQLANVYREEGVVTRDDTKALHWLELAGKGELPEANLALAMAYHNGELGLAADDNKYWSYVKETAHDYKHRVVQ